MPAHEEHRPHPAASPVGVRPIEETSVHVEPVFDVRRLEVALGGRHVLGPLDFQVRRGGFVGVLGPNGSGKTTLLRALLGSVKPLAGDALLLGRPIRSYRAAELAQLVGVVPQEFSLEFSFTVAEMVAMGRYAHSGRHAHVPGGVLRSAGEPGWARTAGEVPSAAGELSAADGLSTGRASSTDDPVAAALAETGLSDLADRLVTELSGGERQRALIAQTLAQESPILLLDEPLNNLDLNHQLEIMQLLSRLHHSGKTIIVVLHDLNMAAQYCEEMVLLDKGLVAARGEVAEILTPQVIMDVFRVRVAVHRQGRRPYLTPLWSEVRQDPRRGEGMKVHVIAGGGAASELLEELVLHGLTPSVGVVSVFDTDYATAERYELEVVSAPPFQAFPSEAVKQTETFAAESDVVVVAPVFFGAGNMELLRVVLRSVRRGLPVVFLDADPIERRDLTGGEAVSLVKESILEGAVSVSSVPQAIEHILSLARPGVTARSSSDPPLPDTRPPV